MTRLNKISLLASLIVCVFPPVRGFAGGMAFNIIGETNQIIDGQTLTFVSGPSSINRAGDVVFSSATNNGSSIFSPTQLLVQAGDTIDGTEVLSPSSGRINEINEIVFQSDFETSPTTVENGVFTQTQFVAKPGDTVAGRTLSGANNLTWDHQNHIVFDAGFSGPSPGNRAFVDATMDVILVKTGDTIGGESVDFINTPASFNATGQMVFGGSYFDAEAADGINSTIFSLNSVVAREGDTIGGVTLAGISGAPAINDAGTVVFIGSDSNLKSGVFTQNEILFEVGDIIDGSTVVSASFPQIDNLGNVVFLGSTATAVGLYTPNMKIIEWGDMLDGKEVNGVSSPVLSPNGLLGFGARFTDGTQAAVVVQLVPEPSSGFLSILICVGLTYIWSRNRTVNSSSSID